MNWKQFTRMIESYVVFYKIFEVVMITMEATRKFPTSAHSIMSPKLIFFAIDVLNLFLTSVCFVTKLFAIPKPVQCLLHNAILINMISFCVLHVVSVAIIDGCHGKYYILWYGSLVDKFVFQGLSIIFLSGLVCLTSQLLFSILLHILLSRVCSSAKMTKRLWLLVFIVLAHSYDNRIQCNNSFGLR